MTKGRQSESVLIDSLIANPRNDRVHPPAQLRMLVKSIAMFGQTRPVLARRANRMLIAGHGVAAAIRMMAERGPVVDEIGRELAHVGVKRAALEHDHIDVIFLDVDQQVADQILIADNRSFELGETDEERRAAILEGISPSVHDALGFLPDDIKDLLGEGEDEEILVRLVETGPVDDRYWISIRGPLRDQALALERLKFLMADLPDSEVELGTTTL